MRKAKLVICHKAKDFRALKETGNDRYIAGVNETSHPVEIEPASVADLTNALVDIGVFNHAMPNISAAGIIRIAGKFLDEICTIPDGNLAWDESHGQKQIFYKFKII